ncbi:MAG: MFS transporter [Anaerolineae bacterium]|nr:MFS transporter [Anaerolineae bacterium]
MRTPPAATRTAESLAQASWLPMIILMLAQAQMAFNVNALPVSVGAISEEFNAPATSVGTALVIYSLFVAAFVLLGAKLGKLIGDRLVFQVTVLLHGGAMALMALSGGVDAMNSAQAIAGLAAAALVPTLVVLIAANYKGRQQAQALGLLAGTPAIAGAAAFFIAGFLATALSWRVSFGLLALLSVVIFALSFKLALIPRQSGIRIDLVGAVLAAIAVMGISIGFNNLMNWGLILASPDAPVSLLGLSPAPFLILVGLVMGQAFFTWTLYRQEKGKTPLLSLEVLDSRFERAAVYCLLIIGALGPAVNFLIPLYIQIVQGRSSLFTAVAVVPYTLAIATSAILIVRLYDRLSPRRIAVMGFVTVTIGLVMLAFTIRNEWATPVVILSLIIVGLGEGSLLTLMFNILVAASPKDLAGDVGAMRGVVNNLSTALGTAFASLAAVGLLTLFVTSSLASSPAIPASLQRQVALDNINFVSNDQLKSTLADTTATPEQVDAAVLINTASRLRALKAAFLILAGIAALAIIPALGLPNTTAGEPEPPPKPVVDGGKRKAKQAPQTG